MQLEELRVIHALKKSAGAYSPPNADDGVFYFDSCQRRLWVGNSETLEAHPFLETHDGVDAYLFLLRVVTGLESEVKGETDIFGQFKQAWKSSAVPELESWIQRLFEDAKEVRSNYLQGLGGGSYGTLVRKLLPDEGPVLIVGAGQIARSVAPYLLDRGVVLWNRSVDKLIEFHAELVGKSTYPVTMASNEDEGWRLAKSAVICIPMGAGGTRSTGQTVVHLGGYRHQAGAWSSLPRFKCLDDVFELQRAQNELRSTQLAEAERACDTRAKLRALAGSRGSLSISHGWEDLVTFASV